MSTEENIIILNGLGLPANLAKIYFAVVRYGPSTVNEVAKLAKVRREVIYRSLSRLENLGLIEKLLEKPLRIKAIPVDEALSILIKNEESKMYKTLGDLISRKERFLRSLKSNFTTMTLENVESYFSMVNERSAILAKGFFLIGNAKKSIDIMSSETRIGSIFHLYTESLKMAIRRGVKLRIITDSTSMPWLSETIRRMDSSGKLINIQLKGNLLSSFLIFDGKDIAIATSMPTEITEGPLLFTNNTLQLQVYQKLFESTWNNGR